MDEASKIALISGFGGAILGGLITYLSERNFRSQEAKVRVRRNFQVVIFEVGRTLDELTTIYNSLTSKFPANEMPVLLHSNLRAMLSIEVTKSCLDTEKLFSVSNKKDKNLFSDITLYLRRFNSLLSTLEKSNKMHVEKTNKNMENGLLRPTGIKDIAEYSFNATDSHEIMSIVNLENIYRQIFRNIIKDIEKGYSLVERLNVISDKKLKRLPWHNPPQLVLTKDFEPIPYLRKLPIFEPKDLEKLKVKDS